MDIETALSRTITARADSEIFDGWRISSLIGAEMSCQGAYEAASMSKVPRAAGTELSATAS